MTKKDLRQLELIQECFRSALTVERLCNLLKVSRNGLGARIVALNRKAYLEEVRELE